MNQYISHHFLVICLCATLLSCTTSRSVTDEDASRPSQTELETMFTESDVFSESLTGFVLYDPAADSVLHDMDGDKYFTPASNTKILALYASINTLPDT